MDELLDRLAGGPHHEEVELSPSSAGTSLRIGSSETIGGKSTFSAGTARD